MTASLRPTPEAAIAILRKHFFSREDIVAILKQGKDRKAPFPVEGNGTLDALLAAHVLGEAAPEARVRYHKEDGRRGAMKGRFRVGSYTPAPDNTTRWLCIDFDGPGHADALDDPLAAVRMTLAACEKTGIPMYLEKSGSGSGWHLWCFFDSPLPAAKARQLGLALAPRDAPLTGDGGLADPTNNKGIEVFPKQDKHRRKKGCGNLVWLPWWWGAEEGANLFYRVNGAGDVEPFVPTEFKAAGPEDVERVLAAIPPEIAASAPVLDKTAPAASRARTDEDPKDNTAWKEWRARALEKLDLTLIYGPWLTGKASGEGWLECRVPGASKGDRKPSAGVADGTGLAERGSFHSFHDTEKTLSIFDFMTWRHLAKDFDDAVVQVARMSGVPLPPKATKPHPEAPHSPRHPQIQVNNRQLLDIVQDAWRAVHAANRKPSLFRRSGSMARLEFPDDGKSPFIQMLSEPAVYGVLARTARWVRVTDEAVLNTLPLKEAARDMHVGPDKALPAIEAVVTTPVFGKDGELIARPGYHPDDRLWYQPVEGLDIPDVPDRPTPEQVAAARSLLLDDLLVDFPFVDPSDRAHAVAAMILPFVRRLIPGCTPVHLIEAPSVGSGKGLISNLISIVATGKAADSCTLPVHEDEARKMLTAELAKGRPIVLLDNAKERRTLDCPPLAAVITAESWTDRILGRTEMITLPNQAVWLLTGNNVKLSLEIARRCVRVRIDPGMDRPWRRSVFKHDEIKTWALEHRAELIHAVLVLVRAWLAAGRPLHPTKLGSFESWSGVIGGILQVAGIPNFLGDLEALYETADVEGSMWREFVAAWWETHGTEPKKVAELLELCDARDLMAAILRDGTPRSRQTRLGNALMAARDRVFDGRRITRVQLYGKHRGGVSYALIVGEHDKEGREVPNAEESTRMGTLGTSWGPSEARSPFVTHYEQDGYVEHGDLGDLSSKPRAYTGARASSSNKRACAHARGLLPPEQPKVPMNDASHGMTAGCRMGTLSNQVPMQVPKVPIEQNCMIDLIDLPEVEGHGVRRPP